MITTAGTDILAQILAGDTVAVINKMGLGSGSTAAAYADTALETAYTDHGFQQQTVTATYSSGTLTFTNTFTNGHTAERVVNEVGLFTDTGVLVYRYVFDIYALPNFGYVPIGAEITITITLTAATTDFLGEFTGITGSIGVAEVSFYVHLDDAITVSFDPVEFPTPFNVCYNGIELPNAGIPSFSEGLGAKTWNFSCYTEDYTLINTILRYSGPLTTGNSITGKQFVISSYRAGVLAIKNMTTHVHDLHENCYIQGPISIEPFGDGWWFNVIVVQSAYDEEV